MLLRLNLMRLRRLLSKVWLRLSTISLLCTPMAKVSQRTMLKLLSGTERLLLIGLAFIGSFGIPIIVLVLIIELPQLFFSQRIVRQYNLEISEAILTDLKA